MRRLDSNVFLWMRELIAAEGLCSSREGQQNNSRIGSICSMLVSLRSVVFSYSGRHEFASSRTARFESVNCSS